MKIINAKAENFLSYKEFYYDFTDKGLTLVEGEDIDLKVNTGAGKSAFLDIICYGLFGITSKKLKSDEVINWTVKKNLMVELTIKHKNDTYIIRRFRKHKDHENDFYILKNDLESVPIRGTDSKETQKVLDGILGFNAEIFTKSVYFGQFDNVDKFLSATDAKKKELISEICDLSAYDEMLDVVKEDLKFQKGSLESLNKEILPEKSKLETLNIKHDEMKLSSDRWFKNNAEEISNLTIKSNDFNIKKELEVNKIKKNIEDFDSNKIKNLEDIDRSISNFESDKLLRINKLNDRIKSFSLDQEGKIKLINTHLDNFEKNRLSKIDTVNSDLEAFKLKIEDLTFKLSSHTKIDKTELERIEIDINVRLNSFLSIESEIKEFEIKMAIITNDNNKLRKDLIEEKNKLNDNLESDCPFCRQKMKSSSIEKHINNLISIGLKNKDKIGILKDNIDNLKFKLKDKELITIEQNRLKDSKEIMLKNEFEHKNVISEINSLNNSISERNNTLIELKNMINPYLSQKIEVKAQKHGLTLDIENVKNESNPYIFHRRQKEKEINPYCNQLSSLESKINPYPRMIDDAKSKTNPFFDSINNIINEIKYLKALCESLLVKQNIISKEIDKGLFWRDALGVYIKSYLMDSFLSQLNEQANIYLETLFNGVLRVQIDSVTESKKKTKEKISQKIYNGNIECSYDSLSGGERCRICLAINLALSDITCKTLGDSFSILMLDEILTGLDSSGKAQTMRLLKELEGRFDTIFVIDHTEEFKSLFTNNIVITKSNGFSKINQ